MSQEYRDMTEEDRIVRILRQLPGEPPAPSTVDVARTMVEGRRRRRARRWSAGIGLAAVTAIAAGGGTAAVSAMRDPAPVPVATRSAEPVPAATKPAVPTGCTVALLPTGKIKKALVTSGDPSGRYLAGRVYPPGGKVHTVLWKDGVLQPHAPMPGADASYEDINSTGLAVGTSFDSRDRQQAYASQSGHTGPLLGGRAVAAAVNDEGVIVGTLGEPSSSGVPVRWPSRTGTPVKLPLPSGFTGGDAAAIAEDGTIAGTVHRKGEEGTGYLWLADGSVRLMSPPTFKDGLKATHFWPDSIVDGVVLGRGMRDNGGSRSFESFRYRIATGKYERLPVELFPPALGATNGWVFGATNGYVAVVVSGEEVVQLPKYQGMNEYVVTAFSADGKSGAGYTTDSTDAEPVANRPLRWTCH